MAATDQQRRKDDLAKIHIAKKDLGMDDTTYRAMLLEVGGKTSAGDLDAFGRSQVLAHLRAHGWKPKRKGGNRQPNLSLGRLSRKKQLWKIEALLTVGGKPWEYADALAQRICKVDRLEWVKDDQLYKIITALRKQALRDGWDLSGETE